MKNWPSSVTRDLFKLCGSELHLIQWQMTQKSQPGCQRYFSIIPGSLPADNHNNPLSFGHSQLVSGVEQTSLYNSSPKLQSREWRRKRHEIRVYGNESIRLNWQANCAVHRVVIEDSCSPCGWDCFKYD